MRGAARGGDAAAAAGRVRSFFWAFLPGAAAPRLGVVRAQISILPGRKKIDTLHPGSSFRSLKLGTIFKFGHG